MPIKKVKKQVRSNKDASDLSDSVRFVRFTGLLDLSDLSDLSISAIKKNARRTDGWTDGRTDGPTDGPTDRKTFFLRCVDASKKIGKTIHPLNQKNGDWANSAKGNVNRGFVLGESTSMPKHKVAAVSKRRDQLIHTFRNQLCFPTKAVFT